MAEKKQAEEKAATKAAVKRARMVIGTDAYHDRLGDEVDAGVVGARRGTLEKEFKVKRGQGVVLVIDEAEEAQLVAVGLEVSAPPKPKKDDK